MSIIICHNNQRIDAQEMKALIKFYRMEHLQIGISMDNLPQPGTLCFVDQSITTIPKDLYKAIGVNTLSGNLAEALQGAGSIKLWEENTLGGAANAVKVVHLGCYPVHAVN